MLGGAAVVLGAAVVASCTSNVTYFCGEEGCDGNAGGGGAATGVSVGGGPDATTASTVGSGPAVMLCTSDAMCASGFCRDGVCCDRACDAPCEVCSIAAGAEIDGVCWPGVNDDADGDGFSIALGDCLDCDPLVNPGAFELPTERNEIALDENCDAQIDEPPALCDTNLALVDTSALSAAKALGLCQMASGTDMKHGVVDARWVRADGSPAQGGYNASVQANWGPNVATREGGRLLALSSGHARLPNQPGACGSLTCSITGPGTPPPGFPASVPNCPGSSVINDDIALELTLRAPTNAAGYSIDLDFYSFEFPEWVCTSYNDQFVAIVSPQPVGAQNGNIVFDLMSVPMSVNMLMPVCTYSPSLPQFPCSLGAAELQGTGFDVWNDGAATSWLRTSAPVTAGEIVSIRLAIWDAGDAAWDSTVLLDNFRWLPHDTAVSVLTTPAP